MDIDHDDELEQMFSEFLAEFKGTAALDLELTAALREVVDKCRYIGKKGTVTLKITIDPEDDTTMHVREDVTVTPPKATRPRYPMFATAGGYLSEDHPSKQALPGFKRSDTEGNQ